MRFARPGVELAALRLIDWAGLHRRAVLAGLFLAYSALSLIGDTPNTDESGYLAFASKWLDGTCTPPPERGACSWWGPGLPLLLSIPVKVGVPTELLRILFGPALLAASVGLLWSVLTRCASARLGTAGAISLAMYWPMWLELGSVLTEIPTAFLLTASLWTWVASRNSMSFPMASAAGVLFGICALVKVEFGYIVGAAFILSTAAFAVSRTRRTGTLALTATAAVVVCVPWLAYNHSQSGALFQWGVSGSQNLYWMAAATEPETGSWHSVESVFADQRLARYRSDLAPLRSMDRVEGDAYLMDLSTQRIAEEPSTFLRNVPLNTLRLYANWPQDFYPRPGPKFIAFGITNGAILGAVLVVSVMMTRRRLWNEAIVVPLSVVIVNQAMHIPLASEPRFFYPVVPLCLWVVYAGIGRLREQPAGRTALP